MSKPRTNMAAEKPQAFEFGTKAQTLERLVGRLTEFRVPSLLWFSRSEWLRNREARLNAIAIAFPGMDLIVRSSAFGEDSLHFALAGRYLSVGGLVSTDRAGLAEAIDRVFASYSREAGEDSDGRQHILIQQMVGPCVMSGVVFTRDMNTGAPYYVINYDDETGGTDTVTSGAEYSNRTIAIHRGAVDAVRSPRFRLLMAAVRELEATVSSDQLDIEFALDDDLRPYLLQVRPITTHRHWTDGLPDQVDAALAAAGRELGPMYEPRSGVFGRQSLFGQMPDWNPAEMLGRTPRRLALSLYRLLITESAWAEARQEMGYQVPVDRSLMRSIVGQPYVDVRLSFHSFLPAGLPADLSEKIVNGWIDRLIEHPHLHDKIEFDVATTVYGVDFTRRIAETMPGLLSPAERDRFADCLRGLTNNLFGGSMADALAKVARLEAMQTAGGPAGNGAVSIRYLLTECRALGTVPFATLARHGFAAKALMDGLVSEGILPPAEVEAFRSAIRTVATDLVRDMGALSAGRLDMEKFLERYGHLRPGTYEILSPRYDQSAELFRKMDAMRVRAELSDQPEFSGDALRAVDVALRRSGLEIDAEGLLRYVREATAAREYAKFVFTRTVSDCLERIAATGESWNLRREELSHLDISEILEAFEGGSGEAARETLKKATAEGQKAHELAAAIRLPALLHDVAGLHVVPFQVSRPNFVTGRTVVGGCTRLHDHDMPDVDIAGRIVLIESADPGFDWIFGCNIMALVTKYGGVNSHMSIRCAEFGLPAAIGCGDQIFDRLERAGAAEIDCQQELIAPISHSLFG